MSVIRLFSVFVFFLTLNVSFTNICDNFRVVIPVISRVIVFNNFSFFDKQVASEPVGDYIQNFLL